MLLCSFKFAGKEPAEWKFKSGGYLAESQRGKDSPFATGNYSLVEAVEPLGRGIETVFKTNTMQRLAVQNWLEYSLGAADSAVALRPPPRAGSVGSGRWMGLPCL